MKRKSVTFGHVWADSVHVSLGAVGKVDSRGDVTSKGDRVVCSAALLSLCSLTRSTEVGLQMRDGNRGPMYCYYASMNSDTQPSSALDKDVSLLCMNVNPVEPELSEFRGMARCSFLGSGANFSVLSSDENHSGGSVSTTGKLSVTSTLWGKKSGASARIFCR